MPGALWPSHSKISSLLHNKTYIEELRFMPKLAVWVSISSWRETISSRGFADLLERRFELEAANRTLIAKIAAHCIEQEHCYTFKI